MPSSDVVPEAGPPFQPTAASPPTVGKENKKANGVAKPDAAAPAGDAAPLAGVALKAAKKAEKAAKRAAVISQRPAGSVQKTGPPAAGEQATVAHGSGKPVSDPSKKGGAQGHKRTASTVKDLSPQQKKKVDEKKPWVEEPKPKVEDKTVELFRHLYKKRATTVAGWKDVHPAVQALGQQMRTYIVCGSTARLVAMMQAFQRVSAQTHWFRRTQLTCGV